MTKAWLSLSAIALLVSFAVVGCGVTIEDYQAELQSLKSQLESVQVELQSVKSQLESAQVELQSVKN